MLTVVDRIWSSGGRAADLVDRSDVSFSIYYFDLIMITVFHLYKSLTLVIVGAYIIDPLCITRFL